MSRYNFGKNCRGKNVRFENVNSTKRGQCLQIGISGSTIFLLYKRTMTHRSIMVPRGNRTWVYTFPCRLVSENSIAICEIRKRFIKYERANCNFSSRFIFSGMIVTQSASVNRKRKS